MFIALLIFMAVSPWVLPPRLNPMMYLAAILMFPFVRMSELGQAKKTPLF